MTGRPALYLATGGTVQHLAEVLSALVECRLTHVVAIVVVRGDELVAFGVVRPRAAKGWN